MSDGHAVEDLTRPLNDPDFVADALSPQTLRRIHEAPGFAPAARNMALSRLAVLGSTSPDIRWLVRDLASTGIFYAALAHEAVFGGATVTGLCDIAQDGICSRGRVIAWVERAIGFGLVQVAAGPERWTRRRLILDSRLAAEAVRRVKADCDTFATLAPELGEISTATAALALATYLRVAFELTLTRPDVMRGEQLPIGRLMSTDGGTQLLMYLLSRQPEGASILLVPTPLSVAACARHARISRLQVRRLVRLAEEAGLFEPGPPRWIAPTHRLVDDFGWVLAANLQVLRITAEALMRRRDPFANGRS